jgi:hypothetical protein
VASVNLCKALTREFFRHKPRANGLDAGRMGLVEAIGKGMRGFAQVTGPLAR